MSPQRRHWFAVILPVLLIILLGVGVAGAQDSRTDSTAAGFAGSEAIPAEQVADTSITDATVRMADGRVRVIVQLRSEPAAQTFARAGAEGGGAAALAVAEAQRALVDAEQAAFVSALAGSGINAEVVSTLSTVANAVGVLVAPEQVAALLARPEVVAVVPVQRVERDTSTSIAQIGAPSAWDGSFGAEYTGAGTVIAVIDSGVDYSHRNNNGSGTWPVNPADRATLSDTGGGFPAGNKVIGGYDYVGDAFNGGNPETSGLPVVETATPDPDPIDCSIVPSALTATFGVTPLQSPSGHGSHVAGIAAGFGVNADGSTFTGDYATVEVGPMLIGPGAAPEASVLAMRVFGCFGSAFSDTISEAIDDSVAGKYGAVADVINMSLGSSFGYGGDDAAAGFYNSVITNATLSGTLVVMSAGNNYDTFFVTGSPGATPAGLNVASTSDGGEGGILIDAVQYPARPAVVNKPIAVVGPAPFVYLPGTGCSASQYASFPAGHFAVIDWTGACGSIGLLTAATDAAGAGGNTPLGILVANNVPNAFQNLSCSYAGAQVSPPYVPCVSIQQETGDFLAANAAAQITMDPSLVVFASALSDTISTFSSRGPSRYATAGLKPEIAAPGDAISSTGSGLGTGPQVLGGTSMASPTVAGVAALLMQANPSWSPSQIKALLVNTANNDVYLGSTAGPRIGVQRAGSGRVDVADALNSEVIAYNDSRPDVASVHFGFPAVNPGESTTITKLVRFQNKGATPATYNLSIETYSNANIASFSVSPSSVTIAGLSSETVQVTLTVTVPVSGTLTANRSDLSMASTHVTGLGTLTRQYLTEESANLVASPTSGATVSLRVPLYAAPRSASEMRALENPLDVAGGGSGLGLLELEGKGVFDAASGFPQAVISSVSALQYSGSDDIGDTAFLDDNGAYAPLPELDIQYVGIASDYNSVTPNSFTSLWVGVSTAADWATPNEYFISIYFDGNQDGFTGGPDDFDVYTTAPNISGTTSRSDVFFSVGCITAQPSCFYHEYLNGVPGTFNTYMLNNNVLMVPLYPFLPLNYDGNGATPTRPQLLGGDTSFNFYVETISRSWGVVDVSPVMTFDMANPVFDATVGGGFPMWDDIDGNNVPYAYDFVDQGFDNTVVGGIPAALLLHHHNEPNVLSGSGQNFRRAEIVYFDAEIVDLGITKTSSDADNTVLPGDTMTFFLEVENFSPSTVASATVTDVLPDAVGFQGASPECTHSGEPYGGTVTCTTTLNPGASDSFYVDVQVDPTFVGSFTNTASIGTEVIEGDSSDNSDSVTVLVTPPAPTLIAPSGDINTGAPLFSWNDIDGAGWYFLTVNEGAATIYSGWFEKIAVCTGGICEADPGLDLGPGEYSWTAYAWNSVSGAGPWAPWLNFRVVIAPETPTHIAPLGDITETNPLFQWSESAGADHYHLWVSQADGPHMGYVTDEWLDAAGLCTGGVCSYDAGLSLGAGRYNWWIQAHSDIGGYSAWSSAAEFDVNVAPATPTPIAPTGDITTQTPTFVFSKVEGATWYYLWLSSGSNKVIDQWYSADMICGASECEVTPGLVLPGGYYTWFIQAWTPYGGYSAWSSGTDFTVALAPTAPIQVGPSGSVLQTNPTYTWERSAGATHYYLWVSGPSGYVTDVWYDAAAVCSGSVCSAAPGVVLGDGVHRWWIQAWNPWGGYSLWNGPMVFNVNGPGAIGEPGIAEPIQPVQVAPEDSIENIQVLPESADPGQ
ncbi:MAG: S8 family serine peptidase [Chloroflexi bacterium]|nr:S8 family serine peptidase [Chloroflexota bacterium]